MQPSSTERTPKVSFADPTATILELDRLRETDSAVARRSVSQGLAALARTRPTLALSTAQRWLAEGGSHIESTVQRGLRPLVESRDDTALRIAGFAPSVAVRVVDLSIDDDHAPAFGTALRFSARVVSNETRAVPVLVEYRIEHRNDDGAWRYARGRLMTRTLDPLTDARIRRTHRLPRAPSSRWAPGPTRLVVGVNGRDLAAATFTL